MSILSDIGNNIWNGITGVGQKIANLNVGNAVDQLWTGAKNVWYNLTGQTEKTTSYKALVEREDSAIQRQIEDLKKAGLSPTLFTGSGAGSTYSGQGNPGVPQILERAMAIQSLMKQKADISHTKAETDALSLSNRERKGNLDAADALGMSPIAYAANAELMGKIEAGQNAIIQIIDYLSDKKSSEDSKTPFKINLSKVKFGALGSTPSIDDFVRLQDEKYLDTKSGKVYTKNVDALKKGIIKFESTEGPTRIYTTPETKYTNPTDWSPN